MRKGGDGILYSAGEIIIRYHHHRNQNAPLLATREPESTMDRDAHVSMLVVVLVITAK